MKRSFVVACFAMGMVSAFGQTLPATVSTTVTPPYSVYLSDYLSAESDKIRVIVQFNDLNEPSWDVKLRFTIRSNNIVIQTRPDFTPAVPITLIPGTPMILTPADLSEYFNYNNLTFSGITLNQLNQNGRLPEGLYSFCFEVLDYRSGKPISTPGCSSVWMMLKEPPYVVAPQPGAVIAPATPQNIPFTWQMANAVGPGEAFNNEYQLTVYEVTDRTVDPLNAINNGKALKIFTSEWMTLTTFLYDAGASMLDVGKRYVFTVQVRDMSGRSLYKNDGFSQVSWFDYGYAEGGHIALKEPQNNAAAVMNKPTQFVWSMPDNVIAGQRFKYVLNVVELEEGQDEKIAIEMNEPYATYTTAEMASSFDVTHMLPKPLEPLKQYAWQVRAYTGEQLIASSDVYRVWGPPALEKFMAGSQEILVKSTSNSDLTKLDGVALVKISDDPNTPLLEIPFHDLNIRKTSIQYVLESGEIISDLSIAPIELTPELEENQTAFFYPVKIKITKNEFSLLGNIRWPLPHAVVSGERAYVTSVSKWFNYTEYKLRGLAVLAEGNTFELLDPYQFTLALKQTSDFEVINNRFRLHLNGDLILPKKNRAEKSGPIKVPFTLKDQLFYFTLGDLNLENNFSPMAGSTITVRPRNAILDLSEKESPLKLMATPKWKGLYFETFDVSYPKEADGTHQWTLNEPVVHSFKPDVASNTKAWVTGAGLTCVFNQSFLTTDAGTFNTFPSQMKSIAFKMVDNAISDSEIKGSIKIPIIGDAEDFVYTIPLADNGFQTGYLDQSLEERSFIFNPYGIENKVEVVIRHAVFADNERLDLTIDINIPYVHAQLLAVSDFRVYGDYNIGFGRRNGAVYLDNQVEADYDGFTMFIDRVAASLRNGNYAFSYSATMPLGEEVAGSDGPPRINIHSVQKGSALVADVPPAPAEASDLLPPPTSGANNGVLSIDSMYVSIHSALVDLDGYLHVIKNDPKWGTSFQGNIKGNIKIPTHIDANANLVLGTKDKVKYWYFDAWYLDAHGMGLPVFNMFNMVAMEGKVYRHMELDLNATSTGTTPNLVVNPDIQFGAGLYMQLVDPTGGRQFMSDIGAEVVVKDEGFVVSMEGDISALNDNGRSKSSGADALARKAALEEAAAQATAAALEQLGDINIEIPIGGGQMLGVQANNEEGKFSYSKGSMRVAAGAKVDDVPAGTVTFASGSNEITASGNASGYGSLLMKDGSNEIGLSIEGKKGGSLNLTYDAFQVETAFNRTERSASLLFRYGDKMIDVAANKKDGSGHLGLQYGAKNRMYLELDRSGKGAFEFQYGNNLVGISADSETGSGALRVATGETTLAVEASKQEGTGSFLVQNGDKLLSIQADRAGSGALTLTDGDKLIDVQADKNAGTGQLELKLASDKRMFLAADRAGKGELEFEYGQKLFRIAADKSEGMGELKLRDGNDKYFDVYVNRNENKGHVGFRYGQDSVIALMDGDTSAIALVLRNKQMAIGAHRAGKGGILLQDGQRVLELVADKTQGSGSLRLEDGPDKRMFVSANKTDGTGTIDLAYDNNAVLAEMAPGSRSLSLDINKTAFNISASVDGTAGLGFRKGNLGFEIAVTGNSGSFTLQDGSRYLYIDSDKTLRYQDGSREIVLSGSDGLNAVVHDGNRVIELKSDNEGGRYGKVKVNGVNLEISVGPSGKSIIFSHDGSGFEVSVGSEDYAKIGVTVEGTTYSAIRENSNTYTLSDGFRTLTVSGDKSLHYTEGSSKSISITDTDVALVYDDRSLSFGKGQPIHYSDSDRSFDLGAEGLSITEGSKSLTVTSDNRLMMADGAARSLDISPEGLSLRNDGMEIAIGTDKSLHYSDADRSFTLNTEGVEIAQGDQSMALVNSDAGLGLELKDGGRSLSYSDGQVTLAEGDNSFTLGGDNYLAVSFQGKEIAVGDGSVSYQEGDRTIAFGGENFVELRDGSSVLAISKEKVFTLADGNKSVTISPDKTFSMSDGVRTFTLGGDENIARYVDNASTITVQASEGTTAFSLVRPEVTITSTSRQFKNTSIAVSTSFGKIAITGDANKNIDATFEKGDRAITLIAGKKGPKIIDSSKQEEEKPVEPVLTDVGTQAPGMAGPQYIGKITESAQGGRIKGKVKLYYNSAESHLIANASVASVMPPCLNGAMTIESRGNYWRVDIGSEEKMIKIFPTCSGFGGGGWLSIDPQSIDVGVFSGFKAGGSVKIDFGAGSAKIKTTVEAELGLHAKAEIDPSFVINEAGVWVRLSADLDVDYDVGVDKGSRNIANADLEGDLTFYFNDGTRMVGKLKGHIRVIGIGANFHMPFDQRL